MSISLLPLPYAETALEPAISATTLQTHHGKHHKAYVDKTNAAIEGGELAGKNLEDIVAAAEAKGDATGDWGLFNNAAQVWNHGFYWHSLSPEAQSPQGELAAAIDASFGSFDALKTELATQGTAHFASGWVWLVAKDGKVAVEQTHDAATFNSLGATPLLVIDLWEHAYYIDYKNLRPDYLKQVIDDHLNWAFAGENLSRGAVWAYPA